MSRTPDAFDAGRDNAQGGRVVTNPSGDRTPNGQPSNEAIRVRRAASGQYAMSASGASGTVHARHMREYEPEWSAGRTVALDRAG